MLKRQRPTTPPPSSFSDPSFLLDRPIRPLHAVDPSEPRSKRLRTQPPPLDGRLRGWLASEPAGSHWESDGEEDWIEDPRAESELPLPQPTTANQYKDTNTLLHELHVLNQHRLLFSRPRDQRLSVASRAPLPAAHRYIQSPPVGYGSAAWTSNSESPCHFTHPQFTGDEPVGRSCCIESVKDKRFVEEVQCVRQRYEGTNRLLGSLFLSRRREVEGVTFSAADPSS